MAGENPQTTMPPVPREPMIDQRGQMSSQWTRWIQQVQRVLSFSGGIAWQIVNKSGSSLLDLEQRTHAMLQNVLGWVKDADTAQVRHISNANGKKWEDHVDIVDGNPHGTDHAMLDAILGTGDRHITATENAEIAALDALAAGIVVKVGNATYTVRSVQGTANEIVLSFGDGQSGNPTVSLPLRIAGPREFGTETNKAVIEADGTIRLDGDATGWRDENFSGITSAVGPNAPTLVNWDGQRTLIPSFPHNLTKELHLVREIDHAAKEGASLVVHAHLLQSVNGTGTCKYFADFIIKNDGLPAVTGTLSNTITVNGTAWAEEQRLNLGTISSALLAQGTQIGITLYRLQTDPGTFSNPVTVTTWGYHYEIDTPAGSRQITAK